MSMLSWIKNRLITGYLGILSNYLKLHDKIFSFMDIMQLAVWARLEVHLRSVEYKQTIDKLNKADDDLTLEDYEDWDKIL